MLTSKLMMSDERRLEPDLSDVQKEEYEAHVYRCKRETVAQKHLICRGRVR